MRLALSLEQTATLASVDMNSTRLPGLALLLPAVPMARLRLLPAARRSALPDTSTKELASLLAPLDSLPTATEAASKAQPPTAHGLYSSRVLLASPTAKQDTGLTLSPESVMPAHQLAVSASMLTTA